MHDVLFCANEVVMRQMHTTVLCIMQNGLIMCSIRVVYSFMQPSTTFYSVHLLMQITNSIVLYSPVISTESINKVTLSRDL